jgi:hypothetical protein
VTFDIAHSLLLTVMAQHNLRNCWSVWNAHHLKIKTNFPEDFIDGHEVRRFHKLIKAGWGDIGALHPINHVALKRQFYNAVRRVQDLTDDLPRAENRLNVQVAHNRANGDTDATGIHDDFLATQIDLLRAIKDLVRIERAIGTPADYIRQYDTHKENPLMLEITAFSQRLARVRRQYEGYVPIDSDQIPPMRQPSRSGYQQRRQPHRDIDHHPGGEMFYHHLDTSHQTTAACWILTNGNNVIVDRVVAKDCWYIEEIEQWTDPTMWFGDPMDPITKQLPEALIQEKLVHDSILRIRSWHIHAHKLMCRVCSSINW